VRRGRSAARRRSRGWRAVAVAARVGAGEGSAVAGSLGAGALLSPPPSDVAAAATPTATPPRTTNAAARRRRMAAREGARTRGAAGAGAGTAATAGSGTGGTSSSGAGATSSSGTGSTASSGSVPGIASGTGSTAVGVRPRNCVELGDRLGRDVGRRRSDRRELGRGLLGGRRRRRGCGLRDGGPDLAPERAVGEARFVHRLAGGQAGGAGCEVLVEPGAAGLVGELAVLASGQEGLGAEADRVGQGWRALAAQCRRQAQPGAGDEGGDRRRMDLEAGGDLVVRGALSLHHRQHPALAPGQARDGVVHRGAEGAERRLGWRDGHRKRRAYPRRRSSQMGPARRIDYLRIRSRTGKRSTFPARS